MWVSSSGSLAAIARQSLLVLLLASCSDEASPTGVTGASAGTASSTGGASAVSGGSSSADVAGAAGALGGMAGSSAGAGASGAASVNAGSGGLGQAGGGGGGGGGGSSGGASSGCDATLAASNEVAVNAALDALFVDKQLSAIEKYWADPYLQHNPIAESGVEAFANVMSSIVSSPSFSYERLRTLAECDLAVVQGRYSGTGVIFDMFRLKDGKLVEHWDSDANRASDASGAQPSNPQDTPQSRAVVLAFLARVVAGDEQGARDHLATDYVEHRNGYLDGIKNGSLSYAKVHHVIADGDFVFTLSAGQLDGAAYGFYDLFRLSGAEIAEHWDSRRPVPATTASGLEIF